MLLSLSKILIIVVLFITLANLKQLIYLKFLCFWWSWIYIYIYIYIYIKKFFLDLVYSKEIFYCFCFAVYKMVDCEYSTNIYNVLNISIGTVMRNQETLKFVLDHLKNRKMCKHAVKNLLYRLRYVPDQ